MLKHSRKFKPIAFLIICVFGILSCNGQRNQLPKPSGSNMVGVDVISFIDSSRMELFDNSGTDYRNITIKVWYPTDEKGSFAAYFEQPDFLIDNFNFLETYRNLLTNSYEDTPISKSQKDYPVLLFSHGWGEHNAQNTIMMEELASHGYVVFGIGHSFEAKYAYFPDGSILSINPNSERFNQIMREQQNPEAINMFQEMYEANSDEERMNVFKRSNNLMPKALKDGPKYWAQDIAYMIDQLKEINKTDSRFKAKLNLDKIGVLGMSMGGIATNEVCVNHNKVKAGVNIDGGLFGSVLDTMITKPFMFVNSKRFLGFGSLFIKQSSEDCYSLTVRNSDHYNFTDYGLYPNQENIMVGTIDPAIPIEVMNTAILSFFNKYVLEMENINIREMALKYDIEFASNTDN